MSMVAANRVSGNLLVVIGHSALALRVPRMTPEAESDQSMENSENVLAGHEIYDKTLIIPGRPDSPSFARGTAWQRGKGGRLFLFC
jgi:hypothetical protein